MGRAGPRHMARTSQGQNELAQACTWGRRGDGTGKLLARGRHTGILAGSVPS